MEDFLAVCDHLNSQCGAPESASRIWNLKTVVEIIDEDKSKSLCKFRNALKTMMMSKRSRATLISPRNGRGKGSA